MRWLIWLALILAAVGSVVYGGAYARKSGGNPHLLIDSVTLTPGTGFTTPAAPGSTIDTLTANCSSGSCAGSSFALGACPGSQNGMFAISGSNLNIGGSTVNAGSYSVGITVSLGGAQNSGVCFPFTLVGMGGSGCTTNFSADFSDVTGCHSLMMVLR
jgi:hypothetical protein